MQSQALYSISLIAAFIAGMVALFAPCCVSYLLPAYFGNIFREKKQVLFMTMVYSLGIFVVMVPVVLGAKILSQYVFKLHDEVYTLGGLFMIVVSITSLLGIKLPMPMLRRSGSTKHDIFSTFTLGIFSGITSSCCAPVLMGVVTLSALTPTLFQSLGVGFVYVLGMVTPLYLASLFIDKRNILERPLFKQVITTIHIGNKSYVILVSNTLAALVFFITGVFILALVRTGKLGMPGDSSAMTKIISQVAFGIDGIIQQIPLVNIIFFIGIVGFIIYLIRQVSK